MISRSLLMWLVGGEAVAIAALASALWRVIGMYLAYRDKREEQDSSRFADNTAALRAVAEALK